MKKVYKGIKFETFLLEQTSVLVLSNYGLGEFDNVVEDIL